MERDDKEKDRDKERQREREMGGGREKELDKDREKVKMKEKEKERDLEKKERGGKDSEKERVHDKEKDRERGGGGKELEKERAYENRGKDRDRKKEKEKEKKREHSKKEKDREKEKERDKERERDRAREREREREKVGEREKGREKIGERAAENDREKEREREMRDKEREREVREKERERESREKEKERERELREKEKERERDKERDNEREKDKEHQKLRVRENERDSRERERDNDREYKNNSNKHKDWPEKDKERETEKEHEAEKGEKKRDDWDRPSNESRPLASELEERISRMREERHKASAEQRATAKKADADNDISAWVNKSRKIEQKQRLDYRRKAAKMAKILAEQDNEEDDDNSGDDFYSTAYGAKDLAGLKVKHGFDKVMEGHAVVLTLKDTNVLDGDNVNLAGDELENIEMAEQQAREDAYKAAKKKPGSYEDKFGNDMDALVTRTILPQYDDAVKDEGMILGANGGLSEESRKKLEEVRLRLEGSSAKESLSDTFAKPVSDYFTEEDMLQFKKPVKKKKKLRKKEKVDIDELEAEAVAAGLGAGDLGSRDSEGRRAQKLADEKAEAESRRNAYQNALNKAEDASMILRRQSTVEAMEVDKADSPVYVGDDDEDFYKSLDRARQIALKTQRNAGNAGGGAQAVVARLAALEHDAVSSSQTPVGVEAQDGGLVFTDTGEFCRSLQLDDAIIRRAGPKDVFGEEEEEAPVEEAEKDISKLEGGWTEIVDVEMKKQVGEEESDGGDPVEEPIAEVSVGKGLAGALSLLKERGTLKETVDWGGRNMDKKRSKLVGIVDESNNQVGRRDILLDRVDEFGRTMTPKEAFRKLSHKFHGKGPGKMKQEKKMKQYQEELRLKQMNSGDTPLMSMEKMREAQARMHTPYIVISGHIKPGQTSDPRSGFGTVEKEPIGSLTPMLGDKSAGSLTPMLGDKKVEHFLGIKRKPESVFKEPAAKQPKYEH